MGKHRNPRPESANRKCAEFSRIRYGLLYFMRHRDKIDGLRCGDLIECKICGEVLGQLSKHLVFKHDITIDKYKEMFPGALTIAPNISKVMAYENTKKWNDSDYKDKVAKTISGIIIQQWDEGVYPRTQTEDHAMKRSISAQKTKAKDPEKYKYVSDETRRKISAAAQGISYDEWESFADGQEYCPKFNEECRESNRDKYDRQCFLCDLLEKDNITSTGLQKRLAVHHVDLNKNQGCEGHRWKLVPLCIHCHGKSHTKLWIARIIWLLSNMDVCKAKIGQGTLNEWM